MRFIWPIRPSDGRSLMVGGIHLDSRVKGSYLDQGSGSRFLLRPNQALGHRPIELYSLTCSFIYAIYMHQRNVYNVLTVCVSAKVEGLCVLFRSF